MKNLLLEDDDDDFGGNNDVFASAEDFEEQIEEDFKNNAPVNPEYFSKERSMEKKNKRRKSK